MKKTLLSLLLAYSINSLAQQPEQLFSFNFNNAGTYESYNIAGSIDPGGSGTNQVWDFSKRKFSFRHSNYFMQTTADPSAMNTVKLHYGTIPSASEPLPPSKIYTIQGNALAIAGYQRYNESELYTDQQVLFSSMPVGLGYTLTDSLKGTTGTDIAQESAQRLGKSTTTVDGFGTLILPDGSSSEAFRVKMEISYTDYNPFFKTSKDTSYVNYAWFKPGNNSFPLLEIDTRFGYSKYSTVFIFNSSTLLSAGEEALTSALIQVYPTECRDNITCSYSTSGNALVKILLRNAQGTLLKVLQEDQVAAGAHTSSLKLPELPAGCNFIEVNIDGMPVLKKIIIL